MRRVRPHTGGTAPERHLVRAEGTDGEGEQGRIERLLVSGFPHRAQRRAQRVARIEQDAAGLRPVVSLARGDVVVAGGRPGDPECQDGERDERRRQNDAANRRTGRGQELHAEILAENDSRRGWGGARAAAPTAGSHPAACRSMVLGGGRRGTQRGQSWAVIGRSRRSGLIRRYRVTMARVPPGRLRPGRYRGLDAEDRPHVQTALAGGIEALVRLGHAYA